MLSLNFSRTTNNVSRDYVTFLSEEEEMWRNKRILPE